MKKERPWQSGGGTKDRRVAFMQKTWDLMRQFGWEVAFAGPLNHVKEAIKVASCEWYGMCEPPVKTRRTIRSKVAPRKDVSRNGIKDRDKT